MVRDSRLVCVAREYIMSRSVLLKLEVQENMYVFVCANGNV